eukprot:11467662-Alexandrium_andersonii.AAC.1
MSSAPNPPCEVTVPTRQVGQPAKHGTSCAHLWNAGLRYSADPEPRRGLLGPLSELGPRPHRKGFGEKSSL